jgi:prepilin-type N-terminal cleavage/methylation domain-containing protein
VLARLRRWKQDLGFTVVEFLVVMAILGALAGIVVFSVSGASSSQAAACATEKSTLETAQEAYFVKNSSYAASAAGLKTAGFLVTVPTWYVTDNAVAPYENLKNAALAGNPCA